MACNRPVAVAGDDEALCTPIIVKNEYLLIDTQGGVAPRLAQVDMLLKAAEWFSKEVNTRVPLPSPERGDTVSSPQPLLSTDVTSQ